MPTPNRSSADKPADNETHNETESDKGTQTVTVDASVLQALQEQIAQLQEQQRATQAAQPAPVPSHIIDIEPKGRPEAEQTYIAHTVATVVDGVTEYNTYRMKSEDFPAICAERGW